MKNIYVLPTDKPSRLFENVDCGLSLNDELEPNGIMCQNQNIYITSDEEIKEGDWCLLDHNVGMSTGYSILKCLKSDTQNGEYLFQDKDGDKFTTGRCEKIIITSDTDLIKDGVQAIDDEFLEWFVKNPSCEEVEVSEDYFKPSNIVYGYDTEPYKIILPKKETKQETTADYIDRHIVQAMVEVAKQKMYSEEEVFNLLMELSSRDRNSSSGTPHNIAKWFEQFKK